MNVCMCSVCFGFALHWHFGVCNSNLLAEFMHNLEIRSTYSMLAMFYVQGHTDG